MSSGITVGVRWELADDLDDEHAGRLRSCSDATPPGSARTSWPRMRAHFAAQIKTARAAQPDRAYRELLAEVLDYRRWRMFAFFLHPAAAAARSG